jgi:hypothetical protein
MSEEKLVTPEEFPFPFTPYSIQLDFMKHLYKTLEDGKLGIFESPTGTVEYSYLCINFIDLLPVTPVCVLLGIERKCKIADTLSIYGDKCI